MKSLSVLIILIAVNYVAGSAKHSTSFNFELLDTHLPLQVAEEIFINENDKSIENEIPTYELFSLSKQGHQSDANASHADDNYVCEIHTNRDITLDNSHESMSEIKEESQATILQNAMTLIHESFPADKCLYVFDLNRNYWTYGFCTGDKIIQYHEGAPVEEWGKNFLPESPEEVFVLGRFSKSTKKLSFKNQASKAQYQKYLKDAEKSVTLLDEKLLGYSRHSTQKAVSHIVTDGSECDLTKQPRAVEVLYMCDKNGGTRVTILEALEIKICHYRMFVHVPKLCSYSPFIPDKPIIDSTVDIQCQRIDESSDKLSPLLWDGEDLPLSPHDKFQKYKQNVVLRDHPLFPVRADNKIDVPNHFLAPMGRGFYLGQSQIELNTSSIYFNMRNVVVFNGFYTSFSDLLTQFAKMFYQCMENSLLAPGPSDAEQLVLSWSHSFIVWYEIYDHLGNFLGLARIVRDASKMNNVLKAQLLDPVTLLDLDGDSPLMVKFERPEFDAPYDMWNFQYFSKIGGPLPIKKLQSPKDSLEMIETTTQKVDPIPIIAYNMGVAANNQVQMQLVNLKTKKVLDGEYANDGKFKFFIDIAQGHRKEFTMKPMDPDQDFVGFTVDVGTEDVETLDLVNNINEKHLLIDEDKLEENIRKDSVMDLSLEVNDEFMEPEYTSETENHDLLHHEQTGNSIQNQESDVSSSEINFEDITAESLGQLFSQELEHLIDEL